MLLAGATMPTVPPGRSAGGFRRGMCEAKAIGPNILAYGAANGSDPSDTTWVLSDLATPPERSRLTRRIRPASRAWNFHSRRSRRPNALAVFHQACLLAGWQPFVRL